MTSNVIDDNPAAAEPAAPEPINVSEATVNANRVVTGYVLGSIAAAVIPIPLADLAVLSGVQLKMLHSLANTFRIPFRKEWGKSAVSSLIGGVLPVASTPLLLGSLAKLIPVGGQIVGLGTQAVLNGATTYALGKVFIQHFASGGTFLTFDPEKVRAYFDEQFEEGKKVAAKLRESDRTRETGSPT
jgi:uncharacterized protein (DUF697 family)